MIVRQNRDQQQNQDRQHDQQHEQQKRHAGGRRNATAEIDLMRAKALAGDRGKTFNLRSKAAIEIDEDQSNAENADAISRREIMIGRKRAQSFAPDFGREDFDARRQSDDRRRIEAFHGAHEIQSSCGENRRPNQAER